MADKSMTIGNIASFVAVIATILGGILFLQRNYVSKSNFDQEIAALKRDVLDIRRTSGTLHILEKPFMKTLTGTGYGAKKRINNLPAVIPHDAVAIICSIETYSSQSDHAVHTFGRNFSHSGQVYDHYFSESNEPFNDLLLTHEGDDAGPFTYGHHHGTQIIPLINGEIQVLMNSGGEKKHRVTFQIYGYFK